MAKITEIMETVPYTCNQSATVADVIRQLADMHVGGVPIVDDENRLVGYITDGDIMRMIAHKRPRVFDWGDHMPIIVDGDPIEEKAKELLERPVLEIASRKKIFAEADQEIEEVADLFRREHVRKIAVLEDGKVIGVVSEATIIRYILAMILPDSE